MRTLTLATLAFFLLAPAASAAVIPCNTDTMLISTCQAACSGTWNPTTLTCTTAGGNAATGAGQDVTTLINPLNAGTSLSSFLTSILQFVVTIGTVVIILMVVFVGYKFVTAQGAPDKIKDAKQMLLWTVIGALVLLGAQAIAAAIQATVAAIGG